MERKSGPRRPSTVIVGAKKLLNPTSDPLSTEEQKTGRRAANYCVYQYIFGICFRLTDYQQPPDVPPTGSLTELCPDLRSHRAGVQTKGTLSRTRYCFGYYWAQAAMES